MIFGTALLRIFAQKYIVGGNPSVGPCSIDLTLGDTFLEMGPGRDLRQFSKLSEHDFRLVGADDVPRYVKSWTDGDGAVTLRPGAFMLAAVAERLVIPADLMGELVGKSTWARKGLMVECAGLCDPGYEGNPTLELANVGKVSLYLRPGDYIVQLAVHRVEGDVEPYSGRYQGDSDPQGAR